MQQNLHCGLRFGLSCGYCGQIYHRAHGENSRRGRPCKRIPLPRAHYRRKHPYDYHQPVGRDCRYPCRPARGARCGARIMSIVNVVGSSIANESDDVLYTWAGPEIAVATTKAYSTQLSMIYLIALYISQTMGMLSADLVAEHLEAVKSLPELVDGVIKATEPVMKKSWPTSSKISSTPTTSAAMWTMPWPWRPPLA